MYMYYVAIQHIDQGIGQWSHGENIFFFIFENFFDYYWISTGESK